MCELCDEYSMSVCAASSCVTMIRDEYSKPMYTASSWATSDDDFRMSILEVDVVMLTRP